MCNNPENLRIKCNSYARKERTEGRKDGVAAFPEVLQTIYFKVRGN